MKKITIFMLVLIVFGFWFEGWLNSGEKKKGEFSLQELEGMEGPALSQAAKKLLQQNGFVVTPGHEKEMYEVYSKCKKKNQPIFVTTDVFLHTAHIFFDYALRILEMERLYNLAHELTEKMIHLSQVQYKEA